jgi:hypothetical protein
MRYTSQRDAPLVNLLRRAGALFLVGAAILTGLSLKFSNDVFAVLAIILVALAVASLWVLRETWYEITQTRLRIRCGPSRMAIAWENLLQVAHTQDKRNAPALSFHRLRIDYQQGKHTRTVLISPQEQDGFLRELCEKAAMYREGDIFVRRVDEAAKDNAPQ